MKKQSLFIKTVGIFLIVSILFASCASTTIIQSSPSGANLYINDEPVGKTPYNHTDTKIVGSTSIVKLELDGYEILNSSFSRNEEVDAGAIIGGLFFWIPFLWTMKYKPYHNYELIPLNQNIREGDSHQNNENKKTDTSSKAEELRELKKLLDEKLINQDEFEIEKKKILERK